MTKRDPHADNELIDRLQEGGDAPSQGGSGGGGANRDVGTRSEMRNTVGDLGSVRPTAQDHPDNMREAKGGKTRDRLAPDGDG